MPIINGIDLNLWFSDNKEDRLAHKRQITSELIEKSIREFQTQSSKVDASNQIKAGLSGLISELNQLLRIQDLHILRKKIAGLNNHS